MKQQINQRLRALDDRQRRMLAQRLGIESISTPELVAYAAGEESLDGGALRDFLQDRLPTYMVPRRITVLDALPRSLNGKVDYNALRSMEPVAVAQAPVAAQDETEQQLAAIWRDVLEISHVGREDDFFDLGGHSLLAMRLFSAIEREFGRSLPLATIFSHPTVVKLADALRPKVATTDNPCLVTLQKGRGRAPLFCMHCGSGNVFHYRELARLLGSDRPVLGIAPSGLDGRSEFHHTVADMAACYVEWITAAYPSGPYLLCGFSYGGTVAYEVARRLREQGRDVAFVGLFDTGVFGTLTLSHSLPGHWRRLAELGPVDKVTYLARSALGNLRTALRNNWRAIQSQGKLLPARTLVALGRPLPVRLQPVYIRRLCSQAMLDYVPESYAGGLTLYRQERGIWHYREHPDMGWAEFVPGDKLQIVDLPGEHGDLLEPPLVNHLAASMRELLKAC